ncbi:MAG: S-methyl-5'-thioinosine phosphorylase [Acidiferrobacterales bacterium]|nr:S-methyl-5'-thioinosine phosphorylase [Acidiferrobacterales bacterium]
MSSAVIAIIGGSWSGALLSGISVEEQIELTTPYGDPSSPIVRAIYNDQPIYLLHRHGTPHSILPHKINYRANIWALSQLKVNTIVAIATCGGIRPSLGPGSILIPDQLIDYTWGRESTFLDGSEGQIGHLEMTHPYCSQLRDALIRAAKHVNVAVVNGGVYGITQGPRFETPAEIDRMDKDGADVVGMTGMPEAALAAEKSICYATVNLIVNPAAGRADSAIGISQIEQACELGYERLNRLLAETLAIVNSTNHMKPDSTVMWM